MKQIEQMVKAVTAHESFVVATVVDTKGSAPGHVGFRMLVFPERIEGTIGGGALEKVVIEDARQMLQKNEKPILKHYKLSDLSMSCGGEAGIFFEHCQTKPALWIFGAGHIARALAPIAWAIGFRLTLVDNRPGFAATERFPPGSELITGAYPDHAGQMPSEAYAVIVTHGHAHDEEILNLLAVRNPPLPYIGMIGSRRKVILILKAMRDKGVNHQDNIYTPIGLKLGGDSAEEIALAIAAEILAVYHQIPGLPHCRILPGSLNQADDR